MLQRLWIEEEGVLAFEWIVLLTLVVIGVIGGVAAIRDAVIHEAQGSVGAMVSLDQGYFVEPPLGVGVVSVAGASDNGCTSSAVYMGAGDNTLWANGRINATTMNQVNQQVVPTTVLCPLP